MYDFDNRDENTYSCNSCDVKRADIFQFEGIYCQIVGKDELNLIFDLVDKHKLELDILVCSKSMTAWSPVIQAGYY